MELTELHHENPCIASVVKWLKLHGYTPTTIQTTKVKGVLHGSLNVTDLQGRTLVRGWFDEGLRARDWRYYNPDTGLVLRCEPYMVPPGKQPLEVIRNGMLDGEVFDYDIEGNIIEETLYSQGVPIKTATSSSKGFTKTLTLWDETGKVPLVHKHFGDGETLAPYNSGTITYTVPCEV